MMTILIINLCMTSIMFLFLSHPLSFGLILLIQTIIIALITGLMTYNFWFSYILFLVLVGGMLILFIYMTSIASNEKFKLSSNLLIVSLTFILITFMSFLLDQYISNTKTVMNLMSNNMYMSLNKFLNWPASMVFMAIIIYLLITLVTVVKITNISHGPLRQKF